MVARVANWWAIVIGGTGGTLAALVGSSGTTAPAAGAPLRPLRELSSQVQSATPAPSLTPVRTPLPTEVQSSLPALMARPEPAAAAPAPALPAAELLPLPTTKQTLLRAEMRCDERKADFCIVAARSYEGGSAGATDPDKAAKYRRIALTAWISQCDHNSPAACATLATMYRSGSGVPQSERNADALVARARELCRYNAVPVCKELPAP